MIKEAIVSHPVEARSGLGRPTIKKYILSKHPDTGKVGAAAFNTHINHAIARGESKGVFNLPKGASGKVKLSAKGRAPAAEKKPAVKKTTTAKKSAAKPAAKKATTTTKKAAPKKASSTTKKTATKAKVRAHAGRARVHLREKSVLTAAGAGEEARGKEGDDHQEDGVEEEVDAPDRTAGCCACCVLQSTCTLLIVFDSPHCTEYPSALRRATRRQMRHVTECKRSAAARLEASCWTAG